MSCFSSMERRSLAAGFHACARRYHFSWQSAEGCFVLMERCERELWEHLFETELLQSRS